MNWEPKAYDSERNVTVWLLEARVFSIWVRTDDQGGWSYTCPDINVHVHSPRVLTAIGHVAAKREAVRAVCRDLRVMAAAAEQLMLKHGK